MKQNEATKYNAPQSTATQSLLVEVQDHVGATDTYDSGKHFDSNKSRIQEICQGLYSFVQFVLRCRIRDLKLLELRFKLEKKRIFSNSVLIWLRDVRVPTEILL